MADKKPIIVNADGTYERMQTGDTLGVANGGTGATTLTSNGVLLGNGTSAVSAVAVGTDGQVLTGVTGGAPTFQTPVGFTAQGGCVTADISVTSSTTFVDCTGIAIVGVAGGTYVFRMDYNVLAGAGGYKFKWTLPSGATGGEKYQGVFNNYNADLTTVVGATASVSSTQLQHLSGYVTFTGAGTAQFQFSQNSSNAAVSKFLAPATILVTRVS